MRTLMNFWQTVRHKKRLRSHLGLGQCLFLSKFRHVSLRQSPLFKKAPKKSLAFLLCLLLAVPVVASARVDVFDSLLRVILPFYKKPIFTPPMPSTPAQELVPSAPLGEEANKTTLEFARTEKNSINAPFGDIPQDKLPAPNLDHLPSVLLDDSLSAGDVLPVLGEPDLYALMMAEFYADRGDIEQALAIYKTESFKKNATVVFERALSLSIEFENPQESLQFASAWQAKNTEHIPAWFYVAHLALKARDYNQAAQTLAMILKYDRRADLTEILTGIIPTNFDDQRALFRALQTVDDDNPSLSVLRAGLLMGMDDYLPALAHVNAALRREPKNLAFIALKMDILRAMGRHDEMWRFLRAKRKVMPHEKELYLPEIRQDIENGQLKKAWELLLVAHRKTQDPEVSLLTALVGLDISEFVKATEIFNELAKRPEFASRANYYLGIGYERSGDIDNALVHYEQVKDYEHVLDARTKVVGFYLIKGDVARAMATLVRLRDDYPSLTTDSYILQAEILMRQDKKQEAEELLIKANRENPDDDRLLFASYKLLENELSLDDKRIAIDKLMQIDPYHLEYQLADAKVRLLQDPNDADALKIATDISEMDVTDPSYDSQIQLEALMVLATNAHAQGRYQAVLDYLQTPYEVAPNLDVGILLLRAYQGLGQTAQVNELLAELQNRFAFGQNRSGKESQIY